MTGLQWVTGYPFNTAGDFLGGPRGKGKDAQLGGILVLLAIAGAVFLVWKLVQGAWDVMNVGKAAAAGRLSNANREMRSEIARRYKVPTEASGGEHHSPGESEWRTTAQPCQPCSARSGTKLTSRQSLLHLSFCFVSRFVLVVRGVLFCSTFFAEREKTEGRGAALMAARLCG